MITVIGHRGAAGVLPENTLKGFAYAVGLGVDAVECDVHLARDGKLVVMHDEKVDRTTNGSGRIVEMDLADIRALDAGDGETVPTLDELLDLIRGKCGLLCELKADGAEGAAVEAVTERGMGGDVVFISFSMQRLADVKRRDADLRTGAVMAVAAGKDVEKAAELGAESVGVHYKNASLGAVERVKNAGMRFGAWTPNKLEEMKAMIDLGVDLLTTDRPDILMDYLGRHGRRGER